MNIYPLPLSASLLLAASAFAFADDLPSAISLEQITRFEPAADLDPIVERNPAQPAPAADLTQMIALPGEPSMLPSGSRMYVTIGGGWAHVRGPATYGISQYSWNEGDATAGVDPHVAFERLFNFSEEQHGWFGNFALGYKPNDNSGLAALELYGRLLGTRDTPRLDPQAAYSGWYSEGPTRTEVVAEAIDGNPMLKQERHFAEFGMKLKGAVLGNNPEAVLSIEPFGGKTNEKTKSSLHGIFGFNRPADGQHPSSFVKTSEIDGWLGGVNLAIEYRLPLSQTAYLQFRTSGGAYAITADGSYTWHSSVTSPGGPSPRTDEFKFKKNDDRSSFGARFGGEAKLAKELFAGLSVAVVAGLDYWSKLPTAQLTADLYQPPVRTVWDDFIFVNAGIELTYEFGD